MGISINVPFYFFNCSLLFNPALVFYQSNYIINSYLLYRRHRYLKRLKASWPSLSAILKQGRLLQPPPELRRPLKRKKPSQVNNCFIFFSLLVWAFTMCVEGQRNGCLGDGFLPPDRFSFGLFALDPYLRVSLKIVFDLCISYCMNRYIDQKRFF